MKTFLRLVFFVLLVTTLAGGFLWYEYRSFLTTAPENPGREIAFDVAPGVRMAQVADELAKRNIVTDAFRFRMLARLNKQDAKLQAGRFSLNTGWPPDKVLDQLMHGKPLLFRLTIPEGLTWWQTARLLEETGFVRYGDFKQTIMDPAFLRHYGIPFASAEGFLMPDTYLLKKIESNDEAQLKSQARSVAGRLVDNFWRKASELWRDGTKPDATSLSRLIILASIVEKETAVASERARVAGVYTNRLDRKMLLQADPTVIYGLGDSFDGNLRRKHLDDTANPYNTYKKTGLPPGPICSFGTAALAAAITPEVHDFLYFVAKTDGGEHTFSKNLSEHNIAVRHYLQNRRNGSR